MKIPQRLALSMALIAVLSVLLAAGFIYGSTRTLFSQYLYQTASGQAQRWVAVVQDYYRQTGSLEGLQPFLFPSGDDPSAFMRPGAGSRRGWNSYGPGPGMRHAVENQGLLVVDARGRVVADAGGQQLDSVLTGPQVTGGLPVEVGGGIVARVILPGPANLALGDLEMRFLTSIARYSALAAVLAIAAALGLGYLLSRRISRPVIDLAGATNRLAEGDLNIRAQVYGDSEIAQLGKNFNLMAQKLQETRTIRENLTADLIHELKTPLAILRGNLESMQSGVVPPGEETLMSLQDEVIRLAKLVDDVELLSRAETGTLPLERGCYSVGELLDNLFPIIHALESEGKVFASDVPADLPDLLVDKHRMLQVMINLMTNAMAHTSPGGKIRLRALPGPDRCLLLTLQDEGQGIPPEKLPYIFDRFYRVDPSRSRTLGGTGLGLAIAKGIVEAHGGRIWAESQLGQGSTFHLLLPTV